MRSTPRTHRLGLGIGLALVLACAGLGPNVASAQEVHVSGPLAGAPAVRHMRLYRGERFNVIPGIGYTLQDEYARSLFVSLEANYHFVEWLGVGVWGGYNVARIDTDLTTQIVNAGQTTDRNRLSLPSASGFSDQISRLTWAASLHLIFIPLRGKLSLFQAVFIDTDLFVLAGVGLFGVNERAATTGLIEAGGAPVCSTSIAGGGSTAECLASQTNRSDRLAVTPMIGVGMSFYANAWFGISIEWRAFPFAWNPSGTDESGEGPDGNAGSGFPDGIIDGTDSRTTFNQMLNIGLIFNLPPDIRTSE